ncbi:hypothetical protein C2E19_10435 [Pseudomonas sp. DTU12.3]|uniref:Uncharacterized protein n=1 Tax=Pseudomonas helmanticensis TaxID=1471381 RepID=A0ACD2U4I1_9PSED|nr:MULTISPECIES: hypothetical protein [Pseudomonas]QAX84255.1 hypothetical protein C2E19_10435 [Pseudomonas sp. DTU12.3]SMQ25213.1 hypothetical protein SAMN04488483_2154 [Pseudomonas helmanticensis]
MIKSIEIKFLTPNGLETAIIDIDSRNTILIFTRKNGLTKSYTSYNLYGCLGELRLDFPEFTFLCKGAKINVHPSSMSSQMSNGLVAYELQMGKNGEDIVRIFDYDDCNLTNDIKIQKAFYLAWANSLAN